MSWTQLMLKCHVSCLYRYCVVLIRACSLLNTRGKQCYHSLITRGRRNGSVKPSLLLLSDPLNNFVVSDFMSHSIRVFSPEGNLLHTIEREGHQPGMLYYPTGVAVTPNRRLVCVSRNTNYGLQIFC